MRKPMPFSGVELPIWVERAILVFVAAIFVVLIVYAPDYDPSYYDQPKLECITAPVVGEAPK